MNEVWKPVKGYEGLYEVSNTGKIRRNGYLMSQHQCRNGYLRCKLTKNGKPKMKLLHRLVAEAFIPNPDNLPQVNHVNENKTDNRVENLEWCTCQYNINYGHRKEKVKAKELNGIRSKQVEQYTIEGELIKVYPSLNEAARQTGLKLSNLNSCCLNKPHYKTCGGYIWKYKEAA